MSQMNIFALIEFLSKSGLEVFSRRSEQNDKSRIERWPRYKFNENFLPFARRIVLFIPATFVFSDAKHVFIIHACFSVNGGRCLAYSITLERIIRTSQY